MKVRIFQINPDNPLPSQANPNDAGWDLYASHDITFQPDEIKLVPLGIIAEAPSGYHFKLCIRSSMAYKRKFTQCNAVGIIDSTYCGPNDEIKSILKAPNEKQMKEMGLNEIVIKKGERVGQLILEKNNDIEWDVQSDRNFAGKDRSGFGSSGV